MLCHVSSVQAFRLLLFLANHELPIVLNFYANAAHVKLRWCLQDMWT